MIAISSFKLKAVATATTCVALGAAAGIVGASAAPGSKSVRPANRPGLRHFWHGMRPGLRHLPGGPAVHATVVVLNKAGTGFITLTLDNGRVQSVSGDKLTIKEAVGKVTYRTVTLTIPAKATIERNFSTVALSALKSGDRVRVEQSSEGTNILALAPGACPKGGGPGHRPGAWGPGGAGRPGVPPAPGGATAPSAPVPQTGA